MKTKLLLLSIALLISASNFANGQQDIIEKSRKLGLVSFLSTVKASSENEVSLMIVNKNNGESYKITKLEDYARLSTNVNRLITQLTVDMYQKNNLKIYKELNEYVRTKGGLSSANSPYGELIREIENDAKAFINKDAKLLESFALANFDLSGIIELPHAIVTDARDARQKKVELIASALKELRLLTTKAILAKKEEKKDAEKAK